jgi:HSP20 family protein
LTSRNTDDDPGFGSAESEVDRLFLDLLHGGRTPRRGRLAFRPNADVYYHHRENAVMVRLELPGIDPDRITLEIEGNILHVRGVRSDQRPPDAVYHQMEISYGRFERLVRLPPGVEASKASAQYSGGYLEVTLPMKQRSAGRQITIAGSDDREEEQER